MEHFEGIDLQTWLNDNEPDEKLFWKQGQIDQCIFVRDYIHPLLQPEYKEQRRFPVRVVGTHKSKSVLLPVFSIAGPSVEVRLRYNFFNWVVSVSSGKTIQDNFFDLFDRNDEVQHIYAEGFEEKWVFGPYAKARPASTYWSHEFSLFLPHRYPLWTFTYLMRQSLMTDDNDQ